MDINEVLGAVARLKRAMPRNADLLLVCEAAERVVLIPKEIESGQRPKPAFDRNAYMRRYMRAWRAKQRIKERERQSVS